MLIIGAMVYIDKNRSKIEEKHSAHSEAVRAYEITIDLLLVGTSKKGGDNLEQKMKLKRVRRTGRIKPQLVELYGQYYYCERSELLIWQVHQFRLRCIKNCAH